MWISFIMYSIPTTTDFHMLHLFFRHTSLTFPFTGIPASFKSNNLIFSYFFKNWNCHFYTQFLSCKSKMSFQKLSQIHTSKH